MSDHDAIQTTGYEGSCNTRRSGIEISSDDARQGESDYATLRVLGLTMVGTILVNLMIAIYITWFEAPLC